jgi:peroxiredoxin
MLIAGVLARLVLFAVFIVAGATKLLDQPGTRKALVGFGVPDALSKPAGMALPVAEVAIGLAFLPQATAWPAAFAAIGLLCIFVVVIGINLAKGRKPDCHCFGQIHSAPIGSSTLVLNGVFLAVAAVIVVDGMIDAPLPSLIAWAAELRPIEWVGLFGGLLGLAMLAGIGALVWQMLAQQGRVLLRLELLEARMTGEAAPSEAAAAIDVFDPATMGPGLPVGSEAPAFDSATLDGRTLSLGDLLAAKKPALLFFADPQCGPCDALMPDIAGWQETLPSHSIVVVSHGNKKENEKKIGSHGLKTVLLQRDQQLSNLYQAWGTPAALLIGADGRVGSRVAQGADRIRTLVAWASGARTAGALMPALPAATDSAAPQVMIGDYPPKMQLPDLAGRPVEVASVNGKRTLLLFWNPGCGFCERMLDDLRAWESARPSTAPELLVISAGSVADNRAMNLRSSVLLDQSFEVAAAFGARGTPMAVMLDENGRIASEVVAGAQQVMALPASEPRVESI